ncbi:MAG: CopZ family metallochaperone [Acidiferrobacter sp.]
MTITTLHITGMTCGHCVAAVTAALKAVPGVESVQVNLERGEGVIKGSASAEQLVQAVGAEGYEARPA